MSTTTAPAAVQKPDSGGLSHVQIRTILFGLMAGMFLAALDQTIVSTSIRTIADDLHGLEIQAWVTTAYLITSTITTPLYGKLSDIYGRRPLFLTAISIFVIGSLACSFSTSMYELAAFRAFQGLGAGGLFSLALAILADIVPPRERAKYQGYFLAVFGTSSVIGPVVGGALAGADHILWFTGWRWVFLVNVPIGIFALFLVMKVLHIPHTRTEHRIDWWGAATLVVGLVPLLVVAEQGNQWGWGSAGVLGLAALGVLGLVAFVLVEIRMQDDALIPMRLFRLGNFSLGMAANTVIGMVMFGAILVLPLFLQLVRGASPTRSGLLLLPLTVGIMIAAIISGQLTARTGKYKIFPVIGTVVLTVAIFLLTTLSADTALGVLFAFFFAIGLGLGLCMQSLILAVQNVVPAKDIGVATSSATFFRQVGATIGVAIFISLLFNALPGKVGTAIQSASDNPAFQTAAAKAANSANPQAIQGYLGGLGAQLKTDSSFLQKVDPILARPYQVGFASATHIVFLVAACLAVLGFILVMALKETPLRTMSAIQERQLDEASLKDETLPAGAEGADRGSAQEAPSSADPASTAASGSFAMAASAPAPLGMSSAGAGPRHGATGAIATGSTATDGFGPDATADRDAGSHSAAAVDGQAITVAELLRRAQLPDDTRVDFADHTRVDFADHGRHEA